MRRLQSTPNHNYGNVSLHSHDSSISRSQKSSGDEKSLGEPLQMAVVGHGEGISFKHVLKAIDTILQERSQLQQQVKTLQSQQQATVTELKKMQGQAAMMLSLMRDPPPQAQLANNTFTMVNDYFCCISLIKKCMVTLTSQSTQKQVRLVGPILRCPLDKFYF